MNKRSLKKVDILPTPLNKNLHLPGSILHPPTQIKSMCQPENERTKTHTLHLTTKNYFLGWNRYGSFRLTRHGYQGFSKFKRPGKY